MCIVDGEYIFLSSGEEDVEGAFGGMGCVLPQQLAGDGVVAKQLGGNRFTGMVPNGTGDRYDRLGSNAEGKLDGIDVLRGIATGEIAELAIG